MKKVLFFATAMILLTGVLAGCGGSQNELDFKSVRDTETGEIFSLGDTREKIDGILGEGEYNENEYMENQVYYKYIDGLISIYYDDEDQVDSISYNWYTDRFELKDMSFDMEREEIAKEFILSEGAIETYEYYYKYYDSNGKATKKDDPMEKYRAMITVNAENSRMGRSGVVVRIDIGRIK